MSETVKCARCEGCGRIANDDDETPWIHWENLPPGSDLAVRAGIVSPIQCPGCEGRGHNPKCETTGCRLIAGHVGEHRGPAYVVS